MNDIEEKFYKVFDIKPHEEKMPYGEWEYYYPEITDRILLELICIVSNFYMDYELPIHLENVEELKECILNSLICIAKNKKTKDVYNQVQSLFTEVNE